MRLRHVLLVTVVLGCLCAIPSFGKKRVVTTRPRLERIESLEKDIHRFSPVPLEQIDSIRLSGYDKPLRSRRESLFVTNNTNVRLVRLALSVSYYDLQGRELHHSEIEVNTDMPPGTTRQVSFPSWDKQLTFVYYRSERSKHGVPYKIKAQIVSATAADETITPPAQ